MQGMKRVLTLLVLCCVHSLAFSQNSSKKILVFNKINRYYHESIPAGQAALQQIGRELQMDVDTTSDSRYFTEDSLKKYAAVVFLSTSVNGVLNTSQKADFERYIQAGGGFMGIHGAAATEYGWEWYGRLLGAVFNGHPKPQDGLIKVEKRKHPSTRHLPK